jgi:hypothetical protein
MRPLVLVVVLVLEGNRRIEDEYEEEDEDEDEAVNAATDCIRLPPVHPLKSFGRGRSVSQSEPGVGGDLDVQADVPLTSAFEFAGVRCRTEHWLEPANGCEAYR